VPLCSRVEHVTDLPGECMYNEAILPPRGSLVIVAQ
jgi:hypothetical protein